MVPPRRRLLSVVCSSFGDPLAEEDGIPYPPLPFSAPLAAELADRLTDVGYAPVERLVDLPAAELGRRVEDFLDSCAAGEVVVVHVIGHGVIHERTAKLLVVGSDGTAVPRTEVERWLTAVEGRADTAPSVLFLVDLCYSGSVARLEWQGHIADEERRAWVIAATGQRDLAYAGRFSRATAVVLARIAAGDLDIAATFEFVPVERVAREIRREVDRLAGDGFEQRVVSIRSDPAAIPHFPFIPNPAYAAGPSVRLDETTRPFLDDVDEALDWWHFASRAAGHALEVDGDRVRPGAFRGRRGELRIIADLFDTATRPGLVLVTGSPGVGKSALLGITVCATHPQLSDLTEPLWRDHRDDLPAVHEGLAAVHCRQRHLGEIVAAVARQLGVPVSTSEPAVLVTALRESAAVPPVVLDALDESMAPADVMTRLILPLSEVARVVVGVRPWDEFEPLRTAATTVLDLDDVPAEDLAAYVDDLLRPVYRTAALRPVRQAIASAVATTLTTTSEWGGFLVAGLFAHQLRNRPVITDLAEAAAAGRAVPRTLPEVFELDLGASGGHSWRPVLTALAYSFGAGMPRSLIEAAVGNADEVLAAARFYLRRDSDEDGTVLYRLFHQGLADYLRRQTPALGPELYTALMGTLGTPPRWRDAEPYLLRHATDHAATAGQLLSVLDDIGFLIFGVPEAMWREYPGLLVPNQQNIANGVYRKSVAKHQYLGPVQRRSVLAIDAYRLGFRDMSTALADAGELPPLAWTVRWATTDVESTWETRRPSSNSVAVGGDSDAPLVAVGDWRGVTVVDVAAGNVTSCPLGLRCLAIGRWDGGLVACLSGPSPMPMIWNVTSASFLFLCDEADSFDHVEFGVDAGVPVVVVVDTAAGLTAWRLPDGVRHGRVRFDRRASVVAISTVGGRMVVASGHDHRLEIARIAKPANRVAVDTGASIAALAVGSFDGREIVLCAHGDGAVDIRDATDLSRIRRLVPGQDDDVFDTGPKVTALAFGTRHGVPVAFVVSDFGFVAAVELATGHRQDGSVRPGGWPRRLVSWGRSRLVVADDRVATVHDVDSGELLASYEPAEREQDSGHDGSVVVREHRGAVRGVAVLDDIVATASNDTTVGIWDLADGMPHSRLRGHRDWVHTVALGEFDGRMVALSGGTDGRTRLWDVTSGESLWEFTGHTGWIRGVAFAGPHGLTAAHDSTVRKWDLRTGECEQVFTTGKRTALTSVAGGVPVVAGGTDGLVHVWGPDRTFAGHRGTVWAVALSEVDGDAVVLSGGEDQTVRMWRLRDGRHLHTLTGFTAAVATVSANRWRDRPVVVAGSTDGTVLGWDLADGGLIAEATFPGPVGGVHLAADGQVAVGFGNDVGVISLRR